VTTTFPKVMLARLSAAIVALVPATAQADVFVEGSPFSVVATNSLGDTFSTGTTVQSPVA